MPSDEPVGVAGDSNRDSEQDFRWEAPTVVPKLAVFHERASMSLFEIAEAARGICDLVWIVGWSGDPDSLPARGLARFGETVDLTGLDRQTMIDRVVDVGPDGVIVFTDPPLGLAAAVAERLGLPFHDVATVGLLRDKLAQRHALDRAGLAVPAFAPVHPATTRIEGTTVPPGFPFPAVLKPRRGAGSRDTFLVEDPARLQSLLSGLQNEDFIVEERIGDRVRVPGRLGADIVSVESLLDNGTIRDVAVTGRFPLAPPFRETGSFLPSDLGAEDTDAVRALAARAATALGARHGVLHTEIKLTLDGPRLIEINGRIGGGIPRLLSRLGGPRLVAMAMRNALGMEAGALAPIAHEPVSFFLWVLAPGHARHVDDTTGVLDLRALPGVKEVRLNRRRGDAVDPREGGSGHVVAIEGVMPSHFELAILRRQIDEVLSLRFS